MCSVIILRITPLGMRGVEGCWEMVGGSELFFCGDSVFEREGPGGSVFAVGRDPRC